MTPYDDNASAKEHVAIQPSGSTFRWPAGVRLTALEEVILVVPGEIVGPLDEVQAAFDASDDIDVKFEFTEDQCRLKTIYLRVPPNKWVQLKKSAEAMVISSDGEPKRIRIG